jgi:hypothetical protein
MISYQTRKDVVNHITDLYLSYFSPYVPKCQLSNYLFKTHVVLGIIFLITFFIFPYKGYQLLIIVLSFIVLLMNLIFSGCILTLVELNLCPGGETIADKPMKLLGIEVNNRNRKLYTQISFFFLILLFMSVYYYLHWNK